MLDVANLTTPLSRCVAVSDVDTGHDACIRVLARSATSYESNFSYLPAWRIRWFGGFNQLFGSVFLLMCALYRSMERKLRLTECKITELTTQLQNRDAKLESLATTISTLKEVTDENERRMEMQRHELKQQYTILREMYMALRMKGASTQFCDSHLLLGVAAGENSKAFWVLRKHQDNLVAITKPYIRQIIRAALESSLVSENIGKYGSEECQTPLHDCTCVFYKALLVRVGETPEALKSFLLLLKQKLKASKPCHQLFNKMLDDLN